jgi:hypothetical protein
MVADDQIEFLGERGRARNAECRQHGRKNSSPHYVSNLDIEEDMKDFGCSGASPLSHY